MIAVGHASRLSRCEFSTTRTPIGRVHSTNSAWARDPDAPTDEALQQLIAERGHDMAYQVAQVYAQRGDRRQTLHWLELAEARGDCGLLNAPTDRWLRAFKDEPRFRELLARFGLALPTS